MRKSLKAQVNNELLRTTTWLTVKQIIDRLGTHRYQTVARALRKLREEGHVQARRSQQSPRYCEWTNSTNMGQVVPATSKPIFQTNPATLLKGGARRSSMCTPNKPTLVDATKAIITEFVTAKRSFSAFDVTAELRERANSGKATIDSAETGTVHVNGKSCPRIEHEIVKGIVHDLHHSGEMPNYDRAHTGAYWQYVPVAATVSPDDASPNTASSASPNTASSAVGGFAVIAAAKNDDYDGTPTL